MARERWLKLITGHEDLVQASGVFHNKCGTFFFSKRNLLSDVVLCCLLYFARHLQSFFPSLREKHTPNPVGTLMRMEDSRSSQQIPILISLLPLSRVVKLGTDGNTH